MPMVSRTWEPIATAPKNGTPVELRGGYIRSNNPENMWGPCTAMWVNGLPNDAECIGWIVGSFDGGHWRVVYQGATHWRPIIPQRKPKAAASPFVPVAGKVVKTTEKAICIRVDYPTNGKGEMFKQWWVPKRQVEDGDSAAVGATVKVRQAWIKKEGLQPA
ncbi:hypothetical protein UFOVP315_31 [uncultured Caudovirales phage]|uniref:Uncharacterized protein n=1 Tax=uncultured Caudovirales phage TaxID=2100421 RepID=A0A6J5LV72_9CAUD|nr:hypothetical protein UFOVP315_31 [uncultured Caudovirales phage]